MRRRITLVGTGRCVLAVVGLACSAAPASAQFSITRYTVDGGGVTAAVGSTFSLGGTIGQPDAGFHLGGTFMLAGGFWLGGQFPPTGIEDLDLQESLVSAAGPSFRLLAPVPNPMSHGTQVAFELPAPENARLLVYNVAGRLVRTLAAGPLPAGRQVRQWDGTEDGGERVAAGVYFVRLQTEHKEAHRRILVLR